jgi:hypothetical protein
MGVPATQLIPSEIFDLLMSLTCNMTAATGWDPILRKPIGELVSKTDKEMKEYVLMWPDWDIDRTGAALDRLIPILIRMHELLMEESGKRRAKSKLFGV